MASCESSCHTCGQLQTKNLGGNYPLLSNTMSKSSTSTYLAMLSHQLSLPIVARSRVIQLGAFALGVRAANHIYVVFLRSHACMIWRVSRS